MSIQALAWVFEQDIPSRAKSVLFALANHADHVTGHCFPSIATIMKEASCSRGAVFNFIALLRRNGFVDARPRQREDGGKRSSDYWLIFDRAAAKWVSSFREETAEIEENSTDDDEVTENGGVGPSSGHVENSPPSPLDGPGESAPWTSIMEPSDSNRSSKLKEGQPLKAQAPQEFSSQARAIEQAKLQAAEEARKPKRIFVIEGSRPWKYWTLHGGHAPTLHTWSQEHKARGWYFETLYPQPRQSTGPPSDTLMKPGDEEDFMKYG